LPQVIGRKRSLTAEWDGWYKPESASASELDVTVKCAKKDDSLPACNATTSPCLYHVTADPCEYNNIAAGNPSIVKNLYATMMAFADQ